MGAGIVQVAAASKYSVTMVDVNDQALQKGQKIILSSLQRIAKKQFETDAVKQKEFIDQIMTRVKVTTDASAASKDADLVIEAIVENIDVKRKLFATLDKAAPSHTIFASNTSSLPIGEIAKACPNRLKNFAGLHFFNPVPQMKLVEVIRIPETDQAVVDALVDFCKKLGKAPVLCKDTPGYTFSI